jgi:hypothetical protein
MIKCVSLTPEINNNSSLKLSGSFTHMADLPGPTIGAPPTMSMALEKASRSDLHAGGCSQKQRIGPRSRNYSLAE